MDMKPYLGQYITANINLNGRTVPSIVMPFKVEKGETEFYWGCGPSRFSAKFVKSQKPKVGEAAILRVYGRKPEDDDGDWLDEVWLYHLRAFCAVHPQFPPEPDYSGAWMGWIAPNGDYYHAAYGDHDGVAACIMATRFNRLMSGYEARELLFKTWLCLRDGSDKGFVTGGYDGMQFYVTESQEKTVRLIAELSGKEWDGMRFRVPTAVTEVLSES